MFLFITITFQVLTSEPNHLLYSRQTQSNLLVTTTILQANKIFGKFFPSLFFPITFANSLKFLSRIVPVNNFLFSYINSPKDRRKKRLLDYWAHGLIGIIKADFLLNHQI